MIAVWQSIAVTSSTFLGSGSVWPGIEMATWTLAVMFALGMFGWYRRETASLRGPASWLLPLLRAVTVLLVFSMWLTPIWQWRRVDGNPGQLFVAVDTSGSMSIGEPAGSEGGERVRFEKTVDRLVGGPDQQGWLAPLVSKFWVDVWGFADEPRLVWSDRTAKRPTWFRPGRSDSDDGQQRWKKAIVAKLTSTDGRSTNALAVLRTWVDQAVSADDTSQDDTGQDDTGQDDTGTRQDDAGQDDAGQDSAGPVGVLWTDGRVDQPAETLDMARQFAKAGGQLHVVGVGFTDEPADLAVLDVLAPEAVASEGRLRGEIVVQSVGYEGKTVRLELAVAGRIVWKQRIEIRKSGRQTVRFDVPASEIRKDLQADGSGGGQSGSPRRYVLIQASIRADSANEDSLTETEGDPPIGDRLVNNEIVFPVVISPESRRLLIVDFAPRWETRYLQNLLQRDPGWRVETVWWMTADEPTEQAIETTTGDVSGAPAQFLPNGFPDSMESWADYDVVVWGELPPAVYTDANVKRLRQFVGNGGGLIVVDGRYGQTVAMPGDLVPVRFPETQPAQGNSEQLRRQAAWPAVESIVPTSLGQSKDVMKLAAGQSDLVSWWRQLPAPHSIPPVQPSPAAEVWAEAVHGEIRQTGSAASTVQDSRSNSGDESRTPWLVTRRYGAGRVFYLATDQTWRWRLGVESRWHGRFWNQLLLAAIPPPFAVQNDYLAIGTDRVQLRPEESASVRIRFQTPEGTERSLDAASENRPVTVDAILTGSNGRTMLVPLSPDEMGGKIWRGQTPPLAEGEYRVSVQAGGYDRATTDLFTSIRVNPPRSTEWDQISLNEGFLKELARVGGGVYVPESQADTLRERLEPRGSGQIGQRQFRWSESWWGWIVVVGLLTTEWWIRKRVGLA